MINLRSMVKNVVVICIVVLTAFVSIARAVEGEFNVEQSDKSQRHNFNKIANKLDLTDAQKAKAKAIFQANKDVVKPIVASLHTEQIALRTLIHADTVDIPAIHAETTKISSIQEILNIDRAKVGADFRAILTPAQLKTLKNMINKSQQKADATANPE